MAQILSGLLGRWFIFSLLALVASVSGSMAQDAAPPKAQPKYTPWNGTFAQTIDIEVPTFRGLEPDLGLSYDSGRTARNFSNLGGELGVGWQLTGLSHIERVSGTSVPLPGQDKLPSAKGVGAYGLAGMPEDSFTLDGT